MAAGQGENIQSIVTLLRLASDRRLSMSKSATRM